MGRERRGSISAAGGQNPNLAGAQFPYLWGLTGPASGQAEVPDLLPSWPLQGPGRFPTSPKSGVNWAFRPRSGADPNAVLDLPGLGYQCLCLGSRSTPCPRVDLAPFEF